MEESRTSWFECGASILQTPAPGQVEPDLRAGLRTHPNPDRLQESAESAEISVARASCPCRPIVPIGLVGVGRPVRTDGRRYMPADAVRRAAPGVLQGVTNDRRDDVHGGL